MIQKRVHIGNGTLKEFQIEYTEMVNTDGKTPIASNIFPIMSNSYSASNDNTEFIYEWVIWYDQDTTINQEIGTDGKVQKKEEEIVI